MVTLSDESSLNEVAEIAGMQPAAGVDGSALVR
jgi:hypothetical protein